MELERQRRVVRSKLATGTKYGRPPDELDDLRREFKTLSLEEHIRRAVESAPALTDDQIDRLRGLLRPGDGR